MRAIKCGVRGLLAAGLFVGGIALIAGQAAAQGNSSAGGSKLPQASARQKEAIGGGAGAHDVNSRKENMQRQKAAKSGASDNAPPKTVP